MKNSEHILSDLEKHISLLDKVAPHVSGSSIGWHIEHSLKVINQISVALERSKPEEYKWKFNMRRMIVFTTKNIPKGRAKAPKIALPEGEITIETLNKSLEKAKLRLQKVNSFNSNAHFSHPYFGLLNLKSAQSFLEIHTNHHLKIIKDIAKN